MAPGVVAGSTKRSVTRRRDQRGDDEDEQLDQAQDADPEDLAHEQVARPDRREDHLDDPALLLLDDAGQHREPEAEDADEDQDRADVGEQEARLVGVGLRVERASTVGGACAAASVAWSTPASASTACIRRARRRPADDELGDDLVGLLL